MINFRYHMVSLIGLFLALAVGVIMGTAVIDRAVVNRLERQQSSLERGIAKVRTANHRLTAEMRDDRAADQELADEGSQRLLTGTLTGVPVLLVGDRGTESDGLADLLALIGRANAEYEGAVWLTEKFTLDSEDDARRLAVAVDAGVPTSAGRLRATALQRVAGTLRPDRSGAPLTPDTLIPALRAIGFLDYDAPENAGNDSFPALDPRTRIIVLSDAKAPVPDRQLMLPFVRALVTRRVDRGIVPVLAVSGQPPRTSNDETFISLLRDDKALTGSMSTVDDIDDFSGRLAAVLALVDLGTGRLGHYGRGPGAQQLLPPPGS